MKTKTQELRQLNFKFHCFKVSPTGCGAQAPTTEAGLALFLLYVSKVLFHPVLNCSVFISKSNLNAVGRHVQNFTPDKKQQMPLT